MLKNFSLLICLAVISCNLAQAEVKKIAVVDVPKVVAKSAEVKALKKDRELNKKEIASILKAASLEIKKETDATKKQEIAKKYEDQLRSKQASIAKEYKTKLELANKNINDKILQQAKSMGYDLVLTKGIVLYGGDDITKPLIKAVR